MSNNSDSSLGAAYLHALAQQLQQEVHAPAQEAALFSSWFQLRQVAASQLIYTPGRRINYVYIVQKGLFRLFRTRADGTEQTLSFHTPGEWLIDLYSFIENQPTQLHLQAVETGSLLVINRTFLNRAMQQLDWYKPLHQQHISNQLRALQQHLAQLGTNGAYNRYQEMMVDQPELLKRIPASLLAGYLGITLKELKNFKG